ncbi:hypothetical protein PR048_030031 [Dryococelus australis]|uniref:DDE Tnp4 domain-containing protein n=1 Tax=Dryococelus australis TaxID=614101 RepID=A0ABQ9G890_9NEOP|nr:hypothetical protein PR048_030031 [Dryococelus australis]
MVFDKLREDDSKHMNFYSMSRNTNIWNCISPPEMLATTYLAIGNTFTDLLYICEKIWMILCWANMSAPTTSKWMDIAHQFKVMVNFLNCIGAVNGKHITIIKPQDSGSIFYNYKCYYSLVVMVVVDTNYDYIYVDVCAYGNDYDSNKLLFGKICRTEEELSCVFVGDEVFALHSNFLRPYCGRELDHMKCFVECAFGIMSNKWRIFHRPLNVSTDLAVDIVKACCILQNFIHKDKGLSTTFVDTIMDENSELSTLPRSQAVRGSLGANAIRYRFANYFVSECGRIPLVSQNWQFLNQRNQYITINNEFCTHFDNKQCTTLSKPLAVSLPDRGQEHVTTSERVHTAHRLPAGSTIFACENLLDVSGWLVFMVVSHSPLPCVLALLHILVISVSLDLKMLPQDISEVVAPKYTYSSPLSSWRNRNGSGMSRSMGRGKKLWWHCASDLCVGNMIWHFTVAADVVCWAMGGACGAVIITDMVDKMTT